jgi:tripartite-type tricarboxylate transporter receptor subunit TctC
MRRTELGRRAALAGLLLPAALRPAAAQDFPSRPLRAVVGFPPGGGVDLAARLVTRRLAELLRQPIVVENRAGAGGTLAAAQVARAEPDGYTLFVSETGMLIGPVLYRDARYDPVQSFAAIGGIATAPLGIAVPASLGIGDLPGAIAQGRAAARPWRFATPGVGTVQHLAGEMLRERADLPLEHVPYRGGAPAVTAAIAGEIEMVVASLPSLLPAVSSGTLRLLATTSAQRVAGLRDVPAVAESIPGFDAAPAIFLVAPAGTPPAAIALLNAALASAIADAGVRDPLLAAGLIAAPALDAAAMARAIAAETAKWSALARASGARLD